MSVNLYLNNKVREHGGFKSQPYKDNSGDEMTFNGDHVFGGKGRLYLMWSQDAPVPDEIRDLVEEISWHESIPQMGRRESGIYRHESAECELTPEDEGNAKREKPVYRLKLKAKKLEDIRALVHKVKTGAIRPEESYEERQGGMTRQQLESELEQTQQQLGEARATVEELQRCATQAEQTLTDYRSQFSGVCEKNVRLRQLALTFKNGFWPMVSSSRVSTQIDAILDDTK